MRAVYRYWAWLVWIAVIVQIGLAGYGAFATAKDSTDATVGEEMFDDNFELHSALGFFILVGTLAFILIALGARVGRRRVLLVAGLFGLVLVQMILAWIGAEVPVLGVLHPINAVAIAGYSWWIASTAQKGEPVLERVTGGP